MNSALLKRITLRRQGITNGRMEGVKNNDIEVGSLERG